MTSKVDLSHRLSSLQTVTVTNLTRPETFGQVVFVVSKVLLLLTFFIWRKPIIKEFDINDKIPDNEEIRLKDESGAVVGIMPAYKAKQIADEKDLDLVKITPAANPPVCQIMNYGKYKFETIKKAKEAVKNQKIVELKEIRLSMVIDDHDVATKAKLARKFLVSGNKVKVSIRMKGRQQAFKSSGIEVMNKFADQLLDVCAVERRPSIEERNIYMILAPSKQ